MMLGHAKEFALRRLPAIVLDGLCTFEGWRLQKKRYTGLTQQYYSFFTEADTWPLTKLVAFQNQRLREIVAYCAAHTPYYEALFASHGIEPRDIRDIRDLPNIPLLDKNTIRRRALDLISDEYDARKLSFGFTGGSTGTPTKLYFSPETWPAQYGFFWARWRPGVERGERYAAFQGAAPDRIRSGTASFLEDQSRCQSATIFGLSS